MEQICKRVAERHCRSDPFYFLPAGAARPADQLGNEVPAGKAMSLSDLNMISEVIIRISCKFSCHQFHALPFVYLCLQAMTEYGQARFSFVSAELQPL